MKTILLIGGIGGTELFIILVIVLLLFGGRKIPQLAKDIGLGIKEFRKSLSEPDDSQKLTYEEEEEEKPIRKKTTKKKAKS